MRTIELTANDVLPKITKIKAIVTIDHTIIRLRHQALQLTLNRIYV